MVENRLILNRLLPDCQVVVTHCNAYWSYNFTGCCPNRNAFKRSLHCEKPRPSGGGSFANLWAKSWKKTQMKHRALLRQAANLAKQGILGAVLKSYLLRDLQLSKGFRNPNQETMVVYALIIGKNPRSVCSSTR
jgi:hypothetical protein